MILEPTIITDDSSRSSVISVVSNLSAAGQTSIGAGLIVGFSLLDVSCKRWNRISLLTDGAENTAPYVKDITRPSINCNFRRKSLKSVSLLEKYLYMYTIRNPVRCATLPEEYRRLLSGFDGSFF